MQLTMPLDNDVKKESVLITVFDLDSLQRLKSGNPAGLALSDLLSTVRYPNRCHFYLAYEQDLSTITRMAAQGRRKAVIDHLWRASRFDPSSGDGLYMPFNSDDQAPAGYQELTERIAAAMEEQGTPLSAEQQGLLAGLLSVNLPPAGAQP